MRYEDLLALLDDVRQRRSELDDVEFKSAHGGTPADLWTTICAFANRRGGGTIVFGVDEDSQRAVGVGDPDGLQRHLAEEAVRLEPPVRFEVSAHLVDGAVVVVAEVPEVDPQFRPCYLRSRGPYHGAYVRVGDGDRPMTEYEVYLALSARVQPQEDIRPVDDATLDDFDADRVTSYLTQVQARVPALADFGPDRAALMRALNLVARSNPDRPTLAGLLTFGRFPQTFFPALVITVSQYPTEGPDAELRLQEDVRCEGPIPLLLDQAAKAVDRLMRHRVVVTGLVHERLPEYPRVALREALVNALAHRDYSRYAVGTQVQVRFYPDRIEIQNPGGLYGPISEDELGVSHVQSTRNAALARMMEDLGLMENRGTGLLVMAGATTAAHLPPPGFMAARTYFRVTLRNERLLTKETLRWLGGFSAYALSEQQRFALAYLRHFRTLTNREFQIVSRLDSRQAGREIKEMVQLGLVEQRGSRGGTHYVLTEVTGAAVAGEVRMNADARLVLAALARHGELSTSRLVAATGLPRRRVNGAVRTLVAQGVAEPTTEKLRSPKLAYHLVRHER